MHAVVILLVWGADDAALLNAVLAGVRANREAFQSFRAEGQYEVGVAATPAEAAAANWKPLHAAKYLVYYCFGKGRAELIYPDDQLRGASRPGADGAVVSPTACARVITNGIDHLGDNILADGGAGVAHQAAIRGGARAFYAQAMTPLRIGIPRGMPADVPDRTIESYLSHGAPGNFVSLSAEIVDRLVVLTWKWNGGITTYKIDPAKGFGVVEQTDVKNDPPMQFAHANSEWKSYFGGKAWLPMVCVTCIGKSARRLSIARFDADAKFSDADFTMEFPEPTALIHYPKSLRLAAKKIWTLADLNMVPSRDAQPLKLAQPPTVADHADLPTIPGERASGWRWWPWCVGVLVVGAAAVLLRRRRAG